MAEIAEATDAAREALLRRIANLAPQLSAAAGVRDLAQAFALTVGAMPGRLPGALGEVKASN
jgi:hypothetical protein